MTNPNTILVTGGNGFIGSRVVEQLLDIGHKVAVLDDNSSPSYYARRNQNRAGATFYKQDIRNPDIYADIVAKHDIMGVIHLAAKHFIPFCNAFPRLTEEVNTAGTYTVHHYATTHHIPIVFASSAAVYCHPNNKTAESADALTVDNADIYSSTKIRGEKILAAGSTPYAALRFFNVYGAFDPHEHLIPKLVRHALDGSAKIQLGSKDSIRDYVYVDDVAQAVITSMQHVLSTRQSFTSDVASGRGTSVNELVDTLLAVHASSSTSHPSPLISYEVCAFRRPKDIKLLESDAEHSRLLKKLGCTPTTPLQKGLQLTLAVEKSARSLLC